MGLLDWFKGNSAAGIIGEVIDKASGVADRFIETKDEKRAFVEKQIDRVYEDRKDARSYSKDNKMLIKIFAITFLVAYVGLTAYLIYTISGGVELQDFAKTIISMLWGGLTAKINTIVDFLFGASEDREK